MKYLSNPQLFQSSKFLVLNTAILPQFSIKSSYLNLQPLAEPLAEPLAQPLAEAEFFVYLESLH